MQYLVVEVKSGSSSSTGEAKVFKSIPDALKYIQKRSNVKQLFISDKDKNIDQLEWILAERLATATLNTRNDEESRWFITAF